MTDDRITVRFSFENFKGRIHLDERGELDSSGNVYINSTPLLRNNEAEIELSLTIDEDGDISILISAYHVTNEETGRAFHSNIEIYMTDKTLELRKLQRFIGFLLDEML